MSKRFFLYFISFCILLSPSAHSAVKIKAVVFDFGGVIAKSDRAGIIKFLEETFHQTEEQLKPIIKEWKKVLANDQNEKKFWVNYATTLNITLPPSWFEEFEKVKNTFIEMPGMIAMVKALHKQGYLTPMLSNVAAYQAYTIRKLGYYKLFDPVLLSCEIGVEKPNLQAYKILLKNIDLPASAVIFVDDQQENVDAAIKLGIDAVLFTDSQKFKEDLQSRGITISLHPHKNPI